MAPRKRKQAARSDTEPDPSSVVVSSVSVDPSKMTVAALREELDSRGLETRGKKAELVARLQAELTGSAAAQGPSPTKKARKKEKKEEPEEQEEPMEEEETDFSKAKKALKVADGGNGGKKTKSIRVPKVDSHVPGYLSYKVVDDYDCMLNQTNIGQNNNKYYVIQLIERGSRYTLWTRWGRVGEDGQNAMKSFGTKEDGVKEYCKKFKDKTKNSWDDRDNFVPAKGKYTLLEMDDDDDGGEEEMIGKLKALDADQVDIPMRQCSLDKPTQNLIKLIFDQDMFRSAMQSMEIDTKKMPLGKLSKAQIAKGFEALEEIEDALKRNVSRPKLAELSSAFYTIIPHSFGRNIPPVIDNAEKLQKKFDMLLVLGDIEIAQGLEREQEKKPKMEEGEIPHPLDLNYQSLKTSLTHIKKEEDEYEIVQNYISATAQCGWRNPPQLLDLFRVDREGEGERFQEHEALENRKLLWHGTNVAVVAAILKSGLRIMPHSGGRVGRGIYFASECSKSAGYVRCAANNTGIMFLNEVALGNEKHIRRDDCSLVKAPSGYDSIVARGHTEPDPKKDHVTEFDGKEVVIPQGRPVQQPEYSDSSFSQSEYLVYKESQNRIRYLLKMKMW